MAQTAAQFRVTVRFGEARKQYRVYDVEARGAADALRAAADGMPEEADAEVDVIEIRRTVRAEERVFTPE